MSTRLASAVRLTAAGFGVAAAGYATYVATTWRRYGRPPRPHGAEHDPLLDRFMPDYEVAERHRVYVRAPAAVTLAAAGDMDLLQCPLTRTIFRTRELILGAKPDTERRPRALLPLVTSLGWGVLAEVPEHEVVVGAVTKPWEANVTFRALPPDEFCAFREPGYVKIVWNLRADRLGAHESIFRTETRVITTDPVSRTKFRRYWAFLSPGIILIRRTSLGPLKREAERRAREARLPRESSAGEPVLESLGTGA